VGTKARVNPASGAACTEIAGAYAMFDGAASPLTQTFGLGMAGAVQTADLDRLERFFTSRGAPVHHEVSPLAGVELMATLAERGYRPIEFTSLLYRPIHPGLKLVRRESDGIRVRRVEAEEHETWVATAAEGWREAGDFTSLMRDVIGVFEHCAGWTPFLAEQGGQPIAAGALSIIDGVGLWRGPARFQRPASKGLSSPC
jgi:hypothetical protein